MPSVAGLDVLFLVLGAILVTAMHGGFAFLEVGTVRQKNQVNALVKILVDFSLSVVAYFCLGFTIAYGMHFFVPASTLGVMNGLELSRFFFLATFAAAIAAIVSGGIAERANFWWQSICTVFLAALLYPLLEGTIWNGNFGIQGIFETLFGAPIHDFAGSLVVHAFGGWVALAAVMVLGPRLGSNASDGTLRDYPPSSVPWLSLGAWLLCVGWFGFNVMSAQSVEGISGLVAMNSLMAMVGGVIVATLFSRLDAGYIHNGALAGLVAVCAGSDLFHPLAALFVGGCSAGLFVFFFPLCRSLFKVDDVLGVWPLHGIGGAWGGIAAGIFGQEFFGGIGGVSFLGQIFGTLLVVVFSFAVGFLVYKGISLFLPCRLSKKEEEEGADISLHRISSEVRFESIHETKSSKS